jgi:hypothetical protein
MQSMGSGLPFLLLVHNAFFAPLLAPESIYLADAPLDLSLSAATPVFGKDQYPAYCLAGVILYY